MPDAVTLSGPAIRLEPLSFEHVQGLVVSAAEDPTLYRWTWVPQGAVEAERYVAEALDGRDRGSMMPFAVVHDGRVVGSTRFCDIQTWDWPDGRARAHRDAPDVCEVGYTWLSSSAVRTSVNTEAKLLMLSHAFDVWDVLRVNLLTDARNEPSRRAIERIGARLDGVLRAARLAADGAIRDTASYSIVSQEWPGVRARLEDLLGRER